MAAVEITFRGTEYDLQNKSSRQVVLIGEAFLTNVGIGGGPIIPPGQPPGIWGGGNVPMPTPPIANVPGAPGYQPPGIWPNPPEGQAPIPSHPIALPGDPWWPTSPPPTIPPPGSPPVVLPGTAPVHPITPPPAIIVDYPGVGKVLVPQPAA